MPSRTIAKTHDDRARTAEQEYADGLHRATLGLIPLSVETSERGRRRRVEPSPAVVHEVRRTRQARGLASLARDVRLAPSIIPRTATRARGPRTAARRRTRSTPTRGPDDDGGGEPPGPRGALRAADRLAGRAAL